MGSGFRNPILFSVLCSVPRRNLTTRRILSCQYESPPATPLDVVRWLREELGQVERTISRIRYLRLRKELIEGVNPEINTDRQVLLSRMETLDFRKKIIEGLEELDPKVYTAGKSFDFKSCMDLIRTIYEWIVQDAANAVTAAKGSSSLGYGKPFQPWKQYLVDMGAVTTDEGEVLQKLYGYLSNAGAHGLGSEAEQVRVTKNTVIEWGLLVVGRVQTMK